MINKVLFLVSNPFNQRDFERFGIELLLENDFDVEVWNLSDVLSPLLVKHYKPPDPINWQHCKVFTNKKPALKELKNIPPDTFIINLIGYSLKSYWLYRALSASQAGYAVLMSNALPFREIGRKLILLYLIKLKSLMKNVVNHSFYQVPFTLLGIKPASLILAGGEQCLKYPYPTDKTTQSSLGSYS